MDVYVVRWKYNGSFCRFSSYRRVDLVENPLAATIYRRKRDAEAKIKDNDRMWIKHEGINVSEFEVVTMTGELKEVK